MRARLLVPILLLLAPGVSAEAPWDLAARATAVGLTGDEALEGWLVALAVHDTAAVPDTMLRINGTGTVELDLHESYYALGPGLAVTGPSTSVLAEGRLGVSAASMDQAVVVQVFAGPGGRVRALDATSGMVRVPDEAALAQRPPVNGEREGRSSDLRDAVSWTPFPGAMLTIDGPAYITIWGMMANVTDGSGEQAVATGSHYEEAVPGAPAGKRTDRELHITLQEGQIDLRPPSRSDTQVHVSGMRGDISVLEAKQASGTLLQAGETKRLNEADLLLRGDIGLTNLQRQANAIAWEASSSSASLVMNGSPVVAGPGTDGRAPQAVTAEPKEQPPYWLAGLLVVPVLSAFVYARPPVRVLRGALAMRRYRYVASRARWSARRGNGTAGLLCATAMLSLGRFQDARDFLDSLDDDGRPDPPTWHYLLATALCGLGLFAQASPHIRQCLIEAPQYQDEVLGNPTLRPALQEMAAAGEGYV